tara:strand:+ start:198 stop:854 length:657 start_codon:yes stop_codon:yes gene_type:complete
LEIEQMNNIRKILAANRVVPVVVLEHEEDILPLCESLLGGGIKIIEITLRTANAIRAISAAVKRFPELTVGAGSIIRVDQISQVVDAGAHFGVTPGTTTALIEAAGDSNLTILPGGSTVSEFMVLEELGFTVLKLFPAEPAGGLTFLKSLTGPLPNIVFCPTGGIKSENFLDYLALKNVLAIGGSWFVSNDLLRRRAWREITAEAVSICNKIGNVENS